MLEVKIPKEIKDYKEKLFLNLTVRQSISLVIGMLVIVPFFLFAVIKLKMNSEIVGWLAIIMGVPLFSIGFFNYRGMSMEKFLIQIIRTYFICPTKRLYRKKNIMEEYLDEIVSEKTKNKKG